MIAATEALVMESPLLRGGHALTHRVHEMFTGNTTKDHSDLVKKIAAKILTPANKAPLYHMEAERINRPLDIMEPAFRIPGVMNKKTFNKGEPETTEVSLLRATITKHERRLDEMQKTVMRLEEGSVCSNRHITHMRRKVSQHETIFQDTLSQTQKSLQQHADMLVKQQHFAKVILKERRESEDMVFDTGFLMLSMYIVQTPLVQYTIHIVTSRWVRGVHRNKRWLPRALQVAYIFHIYHILKYVNIKMGISSKFWNSTQWMSSKLQSLGWQVAKIFAYPGSVLSPRSPTRVNDASASSPTSTKKHAPTPIHLTGLGIVREISLKGGGIRRTPVIIS